MKHNLVSFLEFVTKLRADETMAVAQWVRVLALQAEGCVFESQPRHLNRKNR